VPEVTYLGHKVSAEGISQNKEKLRAAVEAPEPMNVTQLESFVSMVMFYSKFLPQLSTKLTPLFQLLKNGVK
jgi:hypothetical protein